MIARFLMATAALLLAGCEVPGMGPDPKVLQAEADAKAIGSACRHGVRSIEDCYSLNATASKSAIFIGWKDMDQYMRENKIEGVPATIAAKPTPVEEIIEEDNPEPPAKPDRVRAKPR